MTRVSPVMRIPESVITSVERALAERHGRPARVVSGTSVGGGCISPAARVESEAGEVAFLKWGEPGGESARMFAEEARSLRELAATGAVRLPRVLGAAEPDVAGPAWLLLEWLEPGRPVERTWRELGRGLARLHRERADDYGWAADNFIGSLPQPNGRLAGWPDFWRDRRLAPQLRRAYDGGWFDDRDRRRFDRLLERLDERLDGAAEDGASLVHGDLWSGNVHALAGGEAALIDPAAYHGHREVDLAMSELFGGFAPAFYDAYDDAWPLDAAYAERRPVYQLYYLLVHVNLFGGGYVGRTLSALAAAGG